MNETRPPIPEPVKRTVRQQCAFGCVICGLPLYQYDHLVPWAEVEEHLAENLVLLCSRHHDEKTRGLLPAVMVAEARNEPHNGKTGESAPYELNYAGEHCEANVGSNLHVWPTLNEGQFTIPLIVDDTPLVLFRLEQRRLLLTVQLFDEQNQLLVQIVDNELAYSTQPWDVEFRGGRLTVRGGPGDICVRLKFEPPTRVVLDHAKVWRNGIGIDITRQRVYLVNNRSTIAGCQAMNCMLGLAVGDHPPLGGAISIASPRSIYEPDPATEKRVRRVMLPQV